MKRIITAAAVLMLAMLAPTALHASQINVTIDGVEVDFEGRPPVIVDGRTLVPVRGVFEALGFDVDWEQTTQTATLTSTEYTITISIGSDTFTTNSTSYTLDVPAQIIGGRTMLPIRAVLESVGYNVDWDESTNTVIVRPASMPTAQLPIPETPLSLEIRQNSIFAGRNRSYVIMADDTVWMWGNFHDGEGWAKRPGPLMVAENAAAVAEGFYFYEAYAMVLRQDGVLVFYPAGIAALENVAAIVNYWDALTSDGKLWIASTHETRRLTVGNENNIVIDYISGLDFFLTLAYDNSLWGWANFTKEGSPIGITEWRYFEPVWIMDDIAAISYGNYRTLALGTDGTLWAWGNNRYGALGDGTNQNRYSPVQIMNDVVFITTGGRSSFAITADGTHWAWGHNGSGRLGDGTTENRNTPVPIMQNVVEVSAMGHTLAVTADGTLWAWGLNWRGQLGDGTTESRYSPVRIMDGVRVLQ